MAPAQATDSHYVLDRGGLESHRLSRQHEYLNALSHRDTYLPSPIDPNSISTVLDIAAGNLVWTLDLATVPEIRDRLSATSPDPVKLYACDLSTVQFPPAEVTRELGITLFEHDITSPFPDDLNEKFDLVHMRLLVYALTEEGWKKALANVRKVLKPGGHFIMLEADLFMLHSNTPLPVTDWKYEGHLNTLERSHWLRAFHEVYLPSIVTPNDFIPDLVDRLPSLLTSTSWTMVSYTPLVSPVGTLCKTCPGPYGQSMVPFAEFTTSNFSGIFDAATRHSLEHGALHGHGGKIETEEDRLKFLSLIKKGLEEEGMLTTWVEIVATK